MNTKLLPRYPLGNKKRKYRQERFIISTFRADTDDLRRGIPEAKELGFNLVEFGWVPPERSLECITACEEAGIDGIFQNWKAFGGFQETKGMGGIDEEELKKYLAHTKKFRHVAGYYVWDEPLADEKIRAAAEQVALIESMDPERLPFTVAIPSYNATHTWENGLFPEYLRKYADVIEPAVMSLDYYPFSPRRQEPADQLDSCKLFLDIALLRRIALEKEMPMWFYFQSQDDPAHGTYFNLAPEKLRMQQYNAILYGAKGLQNYNIFEGALNKDGTRGPLYWFTKELNHRSAMWGKTLMALTSKHVFHSPEVLKDNPCFDPFRESLSASKVLLPGDLPFRCSVGEFEDAEGNVYLFIQNRDYYEKRPFTLQLNRDYRVYQVSCLDGFQHLSEEAASYLTLRLDPGDAQLIRLQAPAEEACLIDYVLQK